MGFAVRSNLLGAVFAAAKAPVLHIGLRAFQ